MPYRLLDRFRQLFEAAPYLHRNSTLGDSVAECIYQDLLDLGRSKKFVDGVTNGTHAMNRKNRRVGVSARRGDGSFGERVPNTPATAIPGSLLVVGDIATVEIGAEVKILAKAMIKQLDRVGTDMLNQVSEFKRHGGDPICVGIIAVNYAPRYTGYEGTAIWPTDGKKMKHPIQEARQAEERLIARVKGSFFEIVLLQFQATNEAPFAFTWLDADATERHYGATLVRISREYDRRF
jgi:hypothetical protein